jgi:uncharacterized protein YjbI with pentapeptide repeats
VAILGPAGAGKTLAVRHLRAVLGYHPRLALLDEPRLADVCAAWVSRLAVYAAAEELLLPHLATYRLAPWGPDDWVEYLLARHRPRCASVMARVRPADRPLLGDLPELAAAILDRLAGDDSLFDGRHALHRYLGELLSDPDLLGRARGACLNALLAPKAALAPALTKLARPGLGPSLVRALQCRAVQALLAAEQVAADLLGAGACDYLARRLPRDLVKTAASLCAGDRRALAHLHRLLTGPSRGQAMTASLLHALGVGWAPVPGEVPCLAGAYLDGALWPEAPLTGTNLTGTDLTGADLRGANLVGARAASAVLNRAGLRRARLDKLRAAGASFRHADLSEAVAEAANFTGATLDHADLGGANLRGAFLAGADLTAAVFAGADLGRADLRHAQVGGADFGSADLTRATLSGLRLRQARWAGACFREAVMEKCDLEYMDLPGAEFAGANLRGALLTGTAMPGANLAGAQLGEAGLGDVDWERADLRGADLRGASFHMGSSRSGLVGSPTACEGSRTGFYTDDYDEQTYKAPEDIRKANLCGADLRGAKLEGVDFYLVDLRGAAFDPGQAEHLRRCGAILAARV